ncbi:hypothetical protein TNCV_712311 [Trichonephila clavipes]|nr:hypothetical protein TNCV_712311 [Trichonephila clavipes]
MAPNATSEGNIPFHSHRFRTFRLNSAHEKRYWATSRQRQKPLVKKQRHLAAENADQFSYREKSLRQHLLANLSGWKFRWTARLVFWCNHPHLRYILDSTQAHLPHVIYYYILLIRCVLGGRFFLRGFEVSFASWDVAVMVLDVVVVVSRTGHAEDEEYAAEIDKLLEVVGAVSIADTARKFMEQFHIVKA